VLIAMIFRHKKPPSEGSTGMPQLRSRDNTNKGSPDPTSEAKNPLARRLMVDEEPGTKDLTATQEFTENAERDQDEPETRVLSGGSGDVKPAEAAMPENPVSGFLVIISGPGRGSVSMLHTGVNSIGRDLSQQIALDHGDNQISRKGHCSVTYDPETRTFFLQHGEGPQLTYLDGQPVQAITQLTAGNQIRVGDTELRFVPLCGEAFDWNEGQTL
jgi:hypothetical protein